MGERQSNPKIREKVQGGEYMKLVDMSAPVSADPLTSERLKALAEEVSKARRNRKPINLRKSK